MVIARMYLLLLIRAAQPPRAATACTSRSPDVMHVPAAATYHLSASAEISADWSSSCTATTPHRRFSISVSTWKDSLDSSVNRSDVAMYRKSLSLDWTCSRSKQEAVFSTACGQQARWLQCSDTVWAH